MIKKRAGRVVISDFKGMDHSAAHIKLAPGKCVFDTNGRRGTPFTGSWACRRGIRRMGSQSDGAILCENSPIVALCQFVPHQSHDETFIGSPGGTASWIGASASTSQVLALTQAGNIVAYPDMEPRGTVN